MSHIARNISTRFHRNLVAARRTFYTGPESTPDFTGQVNKNETWAAKRIKDIYQRVKDLHDGKVFSNPSERIVDSSDKVLYDMDHAIITKNPDKFHVEVKNKLDFDDGIIGNTIRLESAPNEKDSSGKMDPDFIKSEVQELLVEICERDPQKVHPHRKSNIKRMSRVRLLTDKQLQEELARKDAEAKEKLKMPPVMTEREEIDDVIAHDSVLDGYESSKLVFTDISEDIPHKERFIVVRETSGELRKAKWDERDRMLQVYYPQPQRSIVKPYWTQNLEIPMSRGLHLNLLEQIYGQYEPDSNDYISMTRQVYDHVDHNKLYDLLRSTRFYGCLAFYLAKHKSVDGLLAHIISQQLLPHASGLVRLFALVKPESKTATLLKEVGSGDHAALIHTYVENDATEVEELKSALESLLAENEEQKQAETA